MELYTNPNTYRIWRSGKFRQLPSFLRLWCPDYSRGGSEFWALTISGPFDVPFDWYTMSSFQSGMLTSGNFGCFLWNSQIGVGQKWNRSGIKRVLINQENTSLGILFPLNVHWKAIKQDIMAFAFLSTYLSDLHQPFI